MEGLLAQNCSLGQQSMDEQASPNVSRSRGRLLLVMALAIGLMAAAVLAISWSLNTQTVKNVLLHQVEQRTGHRLEFEDLELRLFPSLDWIFTR